MVPARARMRLVAYERTNSFDRLMLRLDLSSAESHLVGDSLSSIREKTLAAHRTVIDGSGPGAEFLGWRAMLAEPNDALLEDVAATAERIRERADVFVCVGIGGSYLGAKAVIEALSPYFGRTGPEVIFAGHHMSGAYLEQLMRHLDGKSVYVNVISKSGTTLEPALGFRYLRQYLEQRFDDANDRIIVTTDPDAGALNVLRDEKGYKKYVIPPDIGGRFSVLTPVGLLPIAVAGIDIRALFYGAVSARKQYDREQDNAALDYAAMRYLHHKAGMTVEVLAVFEPRLYYLGGWWQQLFGESEGKKHSGLFPAVVQYSTDLHSLGQFVQDGTRTLIETFLMVEDDGASIGVPAMGGNLDGLQYLEGRSMTEINRKAFEGTARAHHTGGVPVQTIWLPGISAESIGHLLYFFEHAVAVGGYMLDVNPFDQPGVEDYKREMFSLLGKPE
jgi:glucose-6-phosphate isomerase